MERKVYRYNVDDLDDDRAIGILLPITKVDGKFSQSYTTQEQAISNLKNLILTAKGERLMLPEYGTDLPKYLFEQVDEDLLDAIEDEIRTAINTWLPYIVITNLIVELENFNSNLKSNLDNHTIFFDITFRVLPYDTDNRIVFFTNEAGAGIVEEQIIG